MKKTLILLVPVILLTGLGCKKYLDVNKNIDAPDHVEAYLYLAGIEQQYEGIYWDIRAIGPLTQMMGTNSSAYSPYANNYYVPGADNAGEAWRIVYWNQGMNLENLINQSEEAGNYTLEGIGYAIKAFSWDMMTKMNGEAPMKEAFEPGRLSHDYDYQDSIYVQVRAWAYKAIELLQEPDPTIYGTKISANDFIYKGDKDKWVKFAYAVIVRNLSSLSNKTDFVSKYSQELIDAGQKSFQTSDDDATLTIAGGSSSAPYGDYNNFWGTSRANLSYTYWQHEFAVDVFTGTVPKYDESTGEKIHDGTNPYYPFELEPEQIITDTLHDLPGHYDPRVAVKLGTASFPNYDYIDNADSVKSYKFYGGTFTGTSGPVGTASSFYGRDHSSNIGGSGTVDDGIGRWIYRDNAPYILMTCAEIKFCMAEAYWKMNDKDEAFQAFKDGVKADMDFTQKYIYPGAKGQPKGGDKITPGVFNALAAEYEAGPYVDQLSMSDFSLSHIMLQKWVALYPWGAPEAWVDMRKYQYDIKYSGDYPKNGDGWTKVRVDQKWDSDPTKVYKGLYLAPAQVEGRKGVYNENNDGSPEYRLRPRYNSEYMWNVEPLSALKPISGTAPNYQCSIPWFAYPGDMPQ